MKYVVRIFFLFPLLVFSDSSSLYGKCDQKFGEDCFWDFFIETLDERSIKNIVPYVLWGTNYDEPDSQKAIGEAEIKGSRMNRQLDSLHRLVDKYDYYANDWKLYYNMYITLDSLSKIYKDVDSGRAYKYYVWRTVMFKKSISSREFVW